MEFVYMTLVCTRVFAQKKRRARSCTQHRAVQLYRKVRAVMIDLAIFDGACAGGHLEMEFHGTDRNLKLKRHVSA